MPGDYAVCQLSADSPLQAWMSQGDICSITWSDDECSVVCDAAVVPDGVESNTGWRVFKVSGPLDFSLTGIIAGITTALANASIAVFVFSTYETDYIMVKKGTLLRATDALVASGYAIIRDEEGDDG